MAAYRGQFGRFTECSWTRRPVRWYCEEEMGGQLGLHGFLRLRGCSHLLGPLGVRGVLWAANASLRWPPRSRCLDGK